MGKGHPGGQKAFRLADPQSSPARPAVVVSPQAKGFTLIRSNLFHSGFGLPMHT